MNGYTQKIYDKIMLFTGKMVKGKMTEGKRELDSSSLVFILGDFERRISEIEVKLKIK